MTALRSASACAACAAAIALSMSCLSVQEYGAPNGAGVPDGGADGPIDPIGGDNPKPEGTYRWDWANPSPTGRTLSAIGGTSATDVWVAGEVGTVAHFDGVKWDYEYIAPVASRWFSIGTKKANDVWLAGTSNGQINVSHYDGKEWTNSYPFAGAAFRHFSHGTGNRLFAVVDWDILELSAEGKWVRTDTSANGVFGPPADVWVATSGEAWTITTGAKLLRLPAGTTKWELQGPIAGVPAQAVGIAMSGAGNQACAFYTGRPTGVGGGAGFLHFDGTTWTAGPSNSTDVLVIDADPHGSTSACLADGTGVLVEGDRVVTASLAAAPGGRMPTDFQGEKLLGALSLDGKNAFVVGTLGAFLARASGTTSFQEKGPTIRKDLWGVDVGIDGAVMLVDALQPDRARGGEVLYWNAGTLAVRKGSGAISPPSLPTAVTVIGASDAWVLTELSGSPAATHFTGAWGLTRRIDGSLFDAEALAIWAPAKDDVWVTARERCATPLPNGACSTPVSGYAWHYDGSAWDPVKVDGVYRSIHGTGPNDVWFAGDGLAHWDGKTLGRVASVKGTFAGVWSSAPNRVWMWGVKSLLFDGTKSIPIETALDAAREWDVQGIAESTAGDVFVLTKRGTGTSLLWYDPSRTKLLEQVASDLSLTTIRGRGNELWAIGAGGAALRFSPPQPR